MKFKVSNSKPVILITGSTGFVGYHLLQTVKSLDFQIKISTRRDIRSNSLSSTRILQVATINSQTNWRDALSSVDIVIHLAARAHQTKETASNPLKAFREVNTEGTVNLVKQSIQAGVKQFIFISSIGAMATLSSEILTENSDCCPDTPYGQSKLEAENMLINLATKTDMAWTILRPTLIYGPHNPGNMSRLLKLISKGLPLPLGSIQNHRSFLFIGNFVDAIIKCINNPNALNKTFIVSDIEYLSTPKLITILSRSLQKNTRLFPIPVTILKSIGHITGQKDSINRLIGSLTVDSSAIRTALNWIPPYTCQEGLQETCDWYLKSLQNNC